MTEPLLVAERLSRQFGGLVANRDVSLALECGKIHALLGPNGAGKSTFINLMSGDLRPSSGRVLFGKRDITALSACQRSRIGIGRSFQRSNVFLDFTVFENCRLAAQSRRQRPWHVLVPAGSDETDAASAKQAIASAELADSESQIAGTLSHGERRQLEIAMVLATNPTVLLLDEPLAGMGSEESARMVALLGRLRADHAILLVEHDMDAVFALADVITVLVNGELLESGPPAAIRQSPAVREAYLGEEEAADA